MSDLPVCQLAGLGTFMSNIFWWDFLQIDGNGRNIGHFTLNTRPLEWIFFSLVQDWLTFDDKRSHTDSDDYLSTTEREQNQEIEKIRPDQSKSGTKATHPESDPSKMFDHGWENFGEQKSKSFYETSTKQDALPEYKIVKTTTSTTTTAEPSTQGDDGWLKSRFNFSCNKVLCNFKKASFSFTIFYVCFF